MELKVRIWFGVATAIKMKMAYTVQDFGTNAKSALPDKK